MSTIPRSVSSRILRYCSVIGLAGICLITACDDTVFDPFNNDGRYFSIYGYLDELETHHEIRVIPITRFPEIIETPGDPQAEIDAEVTTDELVAGELVGSHRWSHRLARLSDGTYGHIYSADFPVTAGRTYRLRIMRSDGIVASASTTVPHVISAEVLSRGPVNSDADTTFVTQEVVAASPISRPWDIRAVFVWEGGELDVDDNGNQASGVNQRRVFVPYGRVGEPTPEGGWRLTLDALGGRDHILADYAYLIQVGRVEPDLPVHLLGMGVEYRIVDAAWPMNPDSVDESFVVQPGSYSNVENGYGFFGSIGFYREVWDARSLSSLIGLSDNAFQSAPR